MKIEYTDLRTIGFYTLGEAVNFIEDLEKDFDKEIIFNVQVAVTSKKGLLVTDNKEFTLLYLK